MPTKKRFPRAWGYVGLGLAGAGLATLVFARQTRAEAKHVVKAVTVRRSPDEVAQFWRASVASSGTVRFQAAPGGRGTEIHLGIESAAEPDLRKLKQVLETGEVIRSSATPVGTHVPQRPAQPLGART